MKNKLISFGAKFGNLPKRYPVETALSVFAFVAGCLAYEDITAASKFYSAALLYPIFYAAAFILNRTNAKRTIYYLSVLLPIPFMFIDGIAEWATRPEYFITQILCLLAVLICGRKRDNKAFVQETLAYAVAGAVAGLLSLAVVAAVAAIYYSVVYIFELPSAHSVIVYAWIASGTILSSAIFLIFQERYEAKPFSAGNVLKILLDYIVTPALIIYTVILYVYLIKTAVKWELPKGGVANMVFAFTIIFTAVKAMQEIIEKRRYDRLFDRSSWVALPPTVLFWAGTARRVAEYGLTEWRVYLIICGTIMTVCIALFFSKRAGRYLYVCIAAFILFAATYIPPLSPGHLAERSQTARIIKAAAEAGVLDNDGRLILGDGSQADTVFRKQHRRIHKSLEYMSQDSVALARFGLSHYFDYAMSLSPETREYCTAYRENDDIEATVADTLTVEETIRVEEADTSGTK